MLVVLAISFFTTPPNAKNAHYNKK